MVEIRFPGGISGEKIAKKTKKPAPQINRKRTLNPMILGTRGLSWTGAQNQEKTLPILSKSILPNEETACHIRLLRWTGRPRFIIFWWVSKSTIIPQTPGYSYKNIPSTLIIGTKTIEYTLNPLYFIAKKNNCPVINSD